MLLHVRRFIDLCVNFPGVCYFEIPYWCFDVLEQHLTRRNVAHNPDFSKRKPVL